MLILTKQKRIVIFDIDGTLADCRHRRHFVEGENKNWEAFYNNMEFDKPVKSIATLLKIVESSAWCSEEFKDVNIVFCSGRPARYWAETAHWLKKYIGDDFYPEIRVDETGEKWPKLLMRKDFDHRPDNEVKQEILDSLKEKGFEILFAVDDRNQVVDMWRRNGITCLQCEKGDF